MYYIVAPRTVNVDKAGFGVWDVVLTDNGREHRTFIDVEQAKDYADNNGLTPFYLVVEIVG